MLPPALLPAVRWLCGVSFVGDYPSWEAAMAECSGYGESSIFKKVSEAAAKVRDGLSAYERDGVNFDKIEYSWPLAAALMGAAAERRGSLNVLDFGGALGSSYFQNREFLKRLPDCVWSVIEQPEFVKLGREGFQTASLRFHESVAEALAERSYDLAFMGASLNYLPDPKAVLKSLTDSGVGTLVLDRTVVMPGRRDRLAVQRMPKSLQDASYPSWIFGEDALMDELGSAFSLLADFQALGGSTWLRAPFARAEFKGYIFKRKNGA